MKRYFGLFSFFLPMLCFAGTLKPITPYMATQIVYGKSSSSTLQLEINLNSLGYTIADDGPGSDGQEIQMFDKKLLAAIKNFQKENELKVTGLMDASTTETINQIINYVNGEITSDDVPTTDATDVYGNDADMNKDYFGDGGDAAYFNDRTLDAVTGYVGSALKSYTGIDITGNAKNFSNDNILSTPSKINSDGTVGAPVTQAQTFVDTHEFVDTSINAFEKTMVSTILGNPAVFVYKAFIDSNSKGLTQISNTGVDGLTNSERKALEQDAAVAIKEALNNTDTVRYTKEQIQQSKVNVFPNGKFDPIKCLQDPICSKL